jgi:hypothetical protein
MPSQVAASGTWESCVRRDCPKSAPRCRKYIDSVGRCCTYVKGSSTQEPVRPRSPSDALSNRPANPETLGCPWCWRSRVPEPLAHDDLVLGFELYRWQPAQGAVPAASVVPDLEAVNIALASSILIRHRFRLHSSTCIGDQNDSIRMLSKQSAMLSIEGTRPRPWPGR